MHALPAPGSLTVRLGSGILGRFQSQPFSTSPQPGPMKQWHRTSISHLGIRHVGQVLLGQPHGTVKLSDLQSPGLRVSITSPGSLAISRVCAPGASWSYPLISWKQYSHPFKNGLPVETLGRPVNCCMLISSWPKSRHLGKNPTQEYFKSMTSSFCSLMERRPEFPLACLNGCGTLGSMRCVASASSWTYREGNLDIRRLLGTSLP